MVHRHESHFLGFASTELFYQSWTSSDSSQGRERATLVVTHGMAEHSECYQRFAEAMVERGWNVIAWDLRGHGRSEGQRGYVEKFSYFAEDLSLFINHLQGTKTLGHSFALVGHSLGGLITLHALVDHGTMGATCVALSSPLLGIGIPVPPIKDFFARSIYRLLPKLTLYNEIAYQDLSRDQAIVESYKLDHLRHEKIAPGLYLGMIETMAYVQSRASSVTLPILIQAAGDDRIVSLSETEKLFAALGSSDKTMQVYPDSYHEIFNDLNRETVYTDLHLYLSRRLGLG